MRAAAAERAPQPLRRPSSQLIESVRRHAAQRPDAVAIRQPDGEVCTYGALAAAIGGRVQTLLTLEPGSVVACVLPGGAEYVAWFCAAIAAGVRLMPMHAQIAGPEARAAADRAGARAVIGGESLGLEQGRVCLAREVSGSPLEPPDRPAGGIVLGSSGTTGLPKLAVRESESLDADADGVALGMRLCPSDSVLLCPPLNHSYGVDVLVGTLTTGAAVTVVTQFDADAVARELMSATVIPGVPFIFEALARLEGHRSPTLRLALSAGSPLPERVRAAFAAAWGIDVGQLYGATELGCAAMDIPGSAGFDPTGVGRPLPGVSMRIVDPQDHARVMPVGEEGHLAVRAPSMLARYLDGEMPMIDGHLLTGDLARQQPDGRVRITGRLKLLIDVGAYKVNPFEVEAVLGAHPAVAECVVVPSPASDTVQRVRAVVVLAAGATASAEELRRHVKERLSPIKVPRTVEFVQRLPKSATGKVLRDRV